MRCPYCGNPETIVKDSRSKMGGTVIRRRRECLKCGKRFTTYERVEEGLPAVIKKDGRREAFNRDKILTGLKKACEKRPISTDMLEGIVNEIENELMEVGVREIESRWIGEKVMKVLKHLDKVAYVRFASVYREFKDVGEFTEVISSLDETTEE
jgi:transcriptional repressor NrdR